MAHMRVFEGLEALAVTAGHVARMTNVMFKFMQATRSQKIRNTINSVAEFRCTLTDFCSMTLLFYDTEKNAVCT